ncbi:uncharacterized protein LOC125476552 isoform X5 [Pyrus x bretschneideri]|uniref:uncharacterized protein LOC125476552 isoform X5 n=1 Tax=Pyrus x bretschneideri TaxID=225117 RepID=UPI00202F6584|nr:uncharacterized protein LOC125476552 isoform X5 [Pyrus x bretschneideri]
MKVLAAAAPLPQRSFFTYRIVDPIPAPIRQTDFGAEDPPRHVGNEGFRIFGESDQAIPEALPSRSASWGCWSWEIKSGVALCKRTIC